jgi:hypothetical protein
LASQGRLLSVIVFCRVRLPVLLEGSDQGATQSGSSFFSVAPALLGWALTILVARFPSEFSLEAKQLIVGAHRSECHFSIWLTIHHPCNLLLS